MRCKEEPVRSSTKGWEISFPQVRGFSTACQSWECQLRTWPLPGKCKPSPGRAVPEKQPRTFENNLNLTQRRNSLGFMDSANSHTGFAQLLWLHKLLLGFQLLLLILFTALGDSKAKQHPGTSLAVQELPREGSWQQICSSQCSSRPEAIPNGIYFHA